jgi:regulator of cell morphogenesis and NO signaling
MGAVDHLVSTHHRYLWDELPRLQALVDKVMGVHGELLRRLRALTTDDTPSADGCASHSVLFSGLEQHEADTHLHVHKENNVLFPAVLETEQALDASTR